MELEKHNENHLVMTGADPCHRNKDGKQAEEGMGGEPTAARHYLIEACRKKGGM